MLVVTLSFSFFPLGPLLVQGGLVLGRTAISYIVRKASVRAISRTLIKVKDVVKDKIKKDYSAITDRRKKVITQFQSLINSNTATFVDRVNTAYNMLESAKGFIAGGVILGASQTAFASDSIESIKNKLHELNISDDKDKEMKIKKLEEEFKKVLGATVTNLNKIELLEKEQKIIGKNIAQTEYDIKVLNKDVTNLTTLYTTLDAHLKTLEQLVEKNSQEIKGLKNNFFITGLEQLEQYNQTANPSPLNNAIDNFQYGKNLLNFDIKYLSYQYYLIATTEEFLYNQKNKKTFKIVENRIVIENSFKNLLVTLPVKYEYLAILTTSYISVVGVLEEKTVQDLLTPIKNYYLELIDKLMQQHKYDTAVSVANDWKTMSGEDTVLEKTKKERDENFQKYEMDFTDIKTIDNILQTNQNTQLVQKAFEILLKLQDKEGAEKLLNTKVFEDKEFRMKAYMKLYYKMGREDKIVELKSLILSNSSYSDELKNWIKRNFR